MFIEVVKDKVRVDAGALATHLGAALRGEIRYLTEDCSVVYHEKRGEFVITYKNEYATVDADILLSAVTAFIIINNDLNEILQEDIQWETANKKS